MIDLKGVFVRNKQADELDYMLTWLVWANVLLLAVNLIVYKYDHGLVYKLAHWLGF